MAELCLASQPRSDDQCLSDRIALFTKKLVYDLTALFCGAMSTSL